MNLKLLSEQAVALHQQGREAEAEQLYLQILAAMPGDFTASYMLGAIRFRQARGNEALALFDVALKDNPGAAGPLVLSGLLLQTAGRRDEALVRFDRALAVNGNLIEALVNRGNVLSEMGRFADALASYDQALAHKPDFETAWHNRGLALRGLNRSEQALESFERALALRPDYADALNNRGSVLKDIGQSEAALEDFDKALALAPGNIAALYNRGTVLQDLKRFREALSAFEQVLARQPDFVGALNNYAAVLQSLNLFAEALSSYDRALVLEPDNAAVLNNRGNVLRDMKRPQEALADIDKALALRPDQVDALNNRGNVLRDLKRPGEALASFDRGLLLAPDNVLLLCNRGVVLQDLKRFSEALSDIDAALALQPDNAVTHYSRGLALRNLQRLPEALISHDWALAIDPFYVAALVDRGDVLRALGRHEEALESCNAALALEPHNTDALNNRGSVFQALRRFDQALADYSEALTIDPDFIEALHNRGYLLGMELRRFEEGLHDLEKLAQLEPERDYLRGDILHLRMHMAEWRDFDAQCAAIDAGVRLGRPIVRPFVYQAISQSPWDLQAASVIYAEHRFPPVAVSRPRPRDRGKIRLGYVSGDFRAQATAFLAAGLYEQHDRGKFEVVAFDAGWDDGSPMRHRLAAAFDKFIDIARLPDRQAAETIAAENIDILINLNGYFGAERMGVFAHMPAPVQVNYLGFPATLGAHYMDYLLADRIVIPEAEREFYTENVVYLPDSYQANDSKRAIADVLPDRAACGLPEKAFVFCNFNNSYKLTPAMFAVWMNILKKREGSVLWLLESNRIFPGHLRREAVGHGVAPERLLFAPPVPPADHLARMALADLFLDQIPYNAHTTASDALWAGLPLLTCRGTSFPGRVGASLLNAVGLPELVTKSLEEYQALALELAGDPARLGVLHHKLMQNRLNAPLFDTRRFCRHLESAFFTMWDIARRGESARSFSVEPFA